MKEETQARWYIYLTRFSDSREEDVFRAWIKTKGGAAANWRLQRLLAALNMNDHDINFCPNQLTQRKGERRKHAGRVSEAACKQNEAAKSGANAQNNRVAQKLAPEHAVTRGISTLSTATL